MSKITILSTTGRLLTDDYKRPKKTITESIQNKKDIQEKLKNYVEITQEELCMLPRNSHVRYIGYNKAKKKELFRFGGLIVMVKPQYVVLSGKGGKTFSAQRYTYNDNGKKLHTTRFFRKVTKEQELENKLNDTIDKSNEIFTKQNLLIEKQQKEIEKLKKMLKKRG